MANRDDKTVAELPTQSTVVEEEQTNPTDIKVIEEEEDTRPGEENKSVATKSVKDIADSFLPCYALMSKTVGIIVVLVICLCYPVWLPSHFVAKDVPTFTAKGFREMCLNEGTDTYKSYAHEKMRTFAYVFDYARTILVFFFIFAIRRFFMRIEYLAPTGDPEEERRVRMCRYKWAVPGVLMDTTHTILLLMEAGKPVRSTLVMNLALFGCVIPTVILDSVAMVRMTLTLNDPWFRNKFEMGVFFATWFFMYALCIIGVKSSDVMLAMYGFKAQIGLTLMPVVGELITKHTWARLKVHPGIWLPALLMVYGSFYIPIRMYTLLQPTAYQVFYANAVNTGTEVVLNFFSYCWYTYQDRVLKHDVPANYQPFLDLKPLHELFIGHAANCGAFLAVIACHPRFWSVSAVVGVAGADSINYGLVVLSFAVSTIAEVLHDLIMFFLARLGQKHTNPSVLAKTPIMQKFWRPLAVGNIFVAIFFFVAVRVGCLTCGDVTGSDPYCHDGE